MKTTKVKFNFLAIIGVMVAIATVAFTAPKSKTTNSLVWYEFTQQVNDDPSLTSNYTKIGASNPAGCQGSAELCAIRASDNGSTPDHDELASLQDEISTGEPTTNVTFKE